MTRRQAVCSTTYPTNEADATCPEVDQVIGFPTLHGDPPDVPTAVGGLHCFTDGTQFPQDRSGRGRFLRFPAFLLTVLPPEGKIAEQQKLHGYPNPPFRRAP